MIGRFVPLSLVLLSFACATAIAQPLGADPTPRPASDIRSPADDHVADASPLRLTFAAGAGHLQVVDELIFGRNTSGPIGALSLSLGRRVDRTSWDVTLETTLGGLANADEQPMTAASGALTLRTSWLLPQEPLGGSLGVGVYVRGSTAVQFYETLDESHAYWLTAYEAGPLVRGAFTLGQGKTLVLALSTPVAAFISRPEEHRLYNNDLPGIGNVMSTVHRDLRFATLDTYRGLAVDVELLIPVGSLTVAAGYGLSYRTTTEPRPVSLLLHAVHVSTSFSL